MSALLSVAAAISGLPEWRPGDLKRRIPWL
jgi:hypothetical protein